MTEPVLIEVCVDSVASAAAAERGGAQRIELCSDLLEGGITPSLGLLQAVRAGVSLPLHVIIRPRGGDFCYSEEEFDIMRRDIEIAKRAGADGVVLGILLPSGCVDATRTRQLSELARPMSTTFHRAFDMSADLQHSLEDVCQTGANRLLTSGGEPDCLQGTAAIAKLVKSARGRIHIMAGGGINAGNVAQILQRTDWMVTLPRRVAQAFNQHGQFTVYPLPVKIPEVEVTVHWHESFDNDEGNQWLREQIIETLRE